MATTISGARTRPPAVTTSPVATEVTRERSCSVDAGVERARRSARTSRAGCTVARVGEPHAAAEDAARCPRLDRRPRAARARRARPRRGSRPSTASSCAARRRDLQHPAAAQPDVLAERLDRREARPRMRGRARAPPRRRAASAAARSAHQYVSQKAAVPAARPVADVRRLEHDHAQRRVAPPERQRGPEPGVAAADDRDVGLGVARERRRLRIGRSLVQPPWHAAQHAVSIADMAERAFWNPMTNMGAFRERGITIVRGEGSTVWDDAGNALLDVSARALVLQHRLRAQGARRRGREADARARLVQDLRRVHLADDRGARRPRRRASSRSTARRSSSPPAAASRSTPPRSSRAPTGRRPASPTST